MNVKKRPVQLWYSMFNSNCDQVSLQKNIEETMAKQMLIKFIDQGNGF